MRPGGGKQKGAGFERYVCEKFSRWIDPKGTDSHFWRSAMSGGRATVRGRQGKKTASQSSDLSAQTKEGLPLLKVFSIECKFVRDLNLVAALVSAKGPLADHWKQVSRDARQHDKHPMLVAKQNGWPPFLIMRVEDAYALFGASNSIDLELGRFCQFGSNLALMFFEQAMEVKYQRAFLKAMR